MFFDHNRIIQEINNRKIFFKCPKLDKDINKKENY